MLRCVVLGLILLLVCSTVGSASPKGDLEQSRRELEEIEQRIEEASTSLTGKQAAARSLNQDLRRVEGQLSDIAERISRLEEREVSLARDQEAEEAAARQSRAKVAEREAQVRERLVSLYKNGDTGFLRIFFSPETPARRAEHVDYLGRIVRRDRELLASYRRELAAHEEVLRRLEEMRAEQQTLLDTLAGERQALEQASRLKRRLLSRARRDEETLSARLAELRQGAERLQRLIKTLESAETREYTQSTGSFASRKGKLLWPVDGELTGGFGRHRNVEIGTLVDSQGYEIAVDGGSGFAAIWPGRVIFAKRFQGYGNLVIVDHGEGFYTLYARGSRLAKRVGDQVAAGETVAFAGDGGSESLYFEIRHRGTPLDPGDWLIPR